MAHAAFPEGKDRSRERGVTLMFLVPTEGRCILWKSGQGKVT